MTSRLGRMTPNPGLAVHGREGFHRKKYHDQEQRILAQSEQSEIEIEWPVEMIEVNREIADALRCGSLEQRSQALARAQHLLQESRP
jgi:hypothetical protein